MKSIQLKFNYGQKVIIDEIEMVITAVLIRDTRVIYELEYFKERDLKTIWKDEKILLGELGKIKKVVGF